MKLKARQAAEAAQVAMERPGLPPHAGQYLPGSVWGSQASVATPTNFSPSPSPRWNYSPEYADGDPHGGFNPNVAFPHCPPPRGPCAFSADINVPYGGSPSYSSSPVQCRGPLPFIPSNGARSPHQFSGPNADARSVLDGMTGDAFMDELITAGSRPSRHARCSSHKRKPAAWTHRRPMMTRRKPSPKHTRRKPRPMRKNRRPKGRRERESPAPSRPSLASSGPPKKRSASPKPGKP